MAKKKSKRFIIPSFHFLTTHPVVKTAVEQKIEVEQQKDRTVQTTSQANQNKTVKPPQTPDK